MFIPRDFPKWDKSVDGLENSWRWVTDCERALLPAEIVFPRTGQIWETLRDCEVNYRAHFDCPWSPSNQLLDKFQTAARGAPALLESYIMQFGTARLDRGEKVRILPLPDPKPIQITFGPVRYNELHESIIPAKVRNHPSYHGVYELSLKIAKTISDFQVAPRQTYFNESFRLLAAPG